VAVAEWAEVRTLRDLGDQRHNLDSESGTTPNTVVLRSADRDIPELAIPGGNIVRNTSVTRQGDFVLANSLVNAVTLVKISK
jgi:hypothetical protein